MQTDEEVIPEVNLLWVGVIVEGGLGLLAIALAYFGLYDHAQPLAGIDVETWKHGTSWGLIATVPMLIYLIVFHFYKPKFYQPMEEFVRTKLYPIFKGSTTFELFLVSLMAGFGEELAFRWCFQGGLTTLLTEKAGLQAATLIGLGVASILFGLCHAVNTVYTISTLLIGLFLGVLMIYTGTFLAPAIAHALFDFIALLYIVRHYGGEQE